MLFSSERNLFISYDRQVFWLVIFSPSQNARGSVDHWKDLQNDSNDFTAAGTASGFHRIPKFPCGDTDAATKIVF